MPDTYTQLYIHFIFAVKYREALIKTDWEERLHKYITGIIQNKGHKLIAINGTSNHLHIFVGFNPKDSIAGLIKEVKRNATNFINDKKWLRNKFSWQEGYGAFSNSRSQIDGVVKYILNQKEHHAKRTFKDEYLEILKDYDVEYDERYFFQELQG